MTLSASKVELAATCTASSVLPQTDEVHAGQEEGNERHDDLDVSIKSNVIPTTLSDRWPGYTWRSEVAFAIDLATGEGRELGEKLNRAYGDIGPFTVVGTADLVGRGVAGELVVVDRKSFDPNVSRAAVNGQLHTLALAACRAYGVVTCDVAIWHELRALDVSIVEPWDLKTYSDQLFEIIETTTRARAEFRKTGLVSATPGKHCRWCPAFHNCPAQSATLTRIKSGVIGTSVEGMLPLETDEQAASAYELLQSIKMLSKRLDTVLRARAMQQEIPVGDGNVYGPRTSHGPRQIDGDKAYDLIREKHGQKVADAAVTREATQKGIVDAFKAAGIAKAESEKERLLVALEKMGAISQKDTIKIDVHPAERPMLKAVGE